MPPKKVRKGLNATLSYQRGGVTRKYRVRCKGVTHGTEMVAEESQARVRRAYYPHRVTTQQFSIQVILVGHDERKSLTNWLASYAAYVLNPDMGGLNYPVMSVTVPVRDFHQQGVPLTGFEWGDRVGSMVFEPTILFEPAHEPWDKTKPAVTRVEDTWQAFAKDDAVKYFYPFGTQLTGDQAPIGEYDKPVYPGEDTPPQDDPWTDEGIPDGQDLSPTK